MADRMEVYRGVVHPWHHDQFGHMNVRHYAPFFDDATFHLYSSLGLTYPDMIERHGVHTVSAVATTTRCTSSRSTPRASRTQPCSCANVHCA